MDQVMEDPHTHPMSAQGGGLQPLDQTVLSGLWRPPHPHPGAVTDGVGMGIEWGCGSPGSTQPVWSDR